MRARTSIVVPVHGQAALTRRCLDAVLATAAGAEIVVVDDASRDSTAQALAGYGDDVRTVTLPSNTGFAAACNRGVEEATGDLLVLLNNDTEPRAGWLDRLIAYADRHPEAAVVGAKLVYPNGTVQHAGVAFGQDGYPHNLYAGLPSDHPAVCRPRRLQAVTGACALIRREAFTAVGGFDLGFTNSLEDVDLCLRIGQGGGEVHLCHDAVVCHLESATRGREERFEPSVALYRERWRDRVLRDDLAIYAEDGLIDVEYPDSYPVRMAIAPELAVLDDGRESEIERLLDAYARQVTDLLQEVVRLTVALGGDAGRAPAGPNGIAGAASEADHVAFRTEARRIEGDIGRLQLLIEERTGGPGNGFHANRRLGARRQVEQVRDEIERTVPSGATVLVVSRGDHELVQLDGRDGQHFPQDERGRYLGHHPADGGEAIERLEALRDVGADYLIFPSTAYWWYDHYPELTDHLNARYGRVECRSCTIYTLDTAADTGLDCANAREARQGRGQTGRSSRPPYPHDL